MVSTHPLCGKRSRCSHLPGRDLEGGEHIRRAQPPILQRPLEMLTRVVEQLVDIVFVGPQLLGEDDEGFLLEDAADQGLPLARRQLVANDLLDDVPDCTAFCGGLYIVVPCVLARVALMVVAQWPAPPGTPPHLV